MPEGFTEMFARRLDECCALDVHEARSGDLLIAGRVLICPGNRHIIARRMPRGDMAVLSDGPPVNGHRPSADVLFHSVAREFTLTSIGVLMTGMGDDGAEGLGAIKAAGGMTVAQSEDTCVVSGMPRAAIIKGYANKIVPLESMSAFLVGLCGTDRDHPDKVRKERQDRKEREERQDTSFFPPHLIRATGQGEGHATIRRAATERQSASPLPGGGRFRIRPQKHHQDD